jgi:adenosylcobinamide-GDP ribazoletransferase
LLTKLRYQFELFLLALGFLSRLPLPPSLPYTEQRMNQAGRYFALVGLFLGALCAAVYSVLSILLPLQLSIFITMVFSLLLTGAFHEDGLADMTDGIGGAMTVEKRLLIMKDSRIGTYGACALLMALLGKFLLLEELANHTLLFPIWLVGYATSRAVATSLIFSMNYVSDPARSKSKPLAQKQSFTDLIFLLFCGVLPCLLLPFVVAASLILFGLFFHILFRNWLQKRLGGFTGDCLGAAQQFMELMIYLLLVLFTQNGIVN